MLPVILAADDAGALVTEGGSRSDAAGFPFETSQIRGHWPDRLPSLGRGAPLARALGMTDEEALPALEHLLCQLDAEFVDVPRLRNERLVGLRHEFGLHLDGFVERAGSSEFPEI